MQDARTEQRIQTIAVLVLAAFAAAFALYWMKPVLVPFVLALFISVGARPVIDWQAEHLHLPRNLAVATTLLLAVLVLFLAGLLVSVSVAQMVANADEYKGSVASLMEDVAAKLPLERLGLQQPQAGQGEVPEAPSGGQPAVRAQGADGEPAPAAEEAAPAQAPTAGTDAQPQQGEGEANPKPARDAVKSLLKIPVEAIGRLLVGTSGAVANILSNSLLVIIFTCFLLFGGQRKPEERPALWAEIESGTRRYIVTKVLVSGATGIMVGLILWLLGVQLAMVFGLLAFLLNFIPSVGSIIATLLPLPVVIVTGLSPLTCVLAIVLPGCVQFAVGNVLEPRLMGRSMKLHPITILLALIFWGVLWGAVGMFLAVPMTSVIRIFLEKNEITAPVARLMAGQAGGAEAG